MNFVVNGQTRDFAELQTGSHLQDLIDNLALQGDRIAVEHNGAIVPCSAWAETSLKEGDRLEIVHFVGGGL